MVRTGVCERANAWIEKRNVHRFCAICGQRPVDRREGNCAGGERQQWRWFCNGSERHYVIIEFFEVAGGCRVNAKICQVRCGQ